MPDPDLTAYLDGEADAEAARRIEARLQADPAFRSAALALLRQRVALSRVLPGLAAQPATRPRPRLRPRPQPQRRRWWLAVVPVAAAAAIAAALLLPSSAAPPPVRPPEVADGPAGHGAGGPLLRLADGGTWRAGQFIERAATYALADGGEFTLEAGATLLVPAPGGPWRHQRGALQASLPAGAAPLATAQAEVRLAGGRVRLSVDEDGTVVRGVAGEVEVADLLTRSTARLGPGMELWLPSDVIAPRETAGANGVTRGTVEAVASGGTDIDLRTRFGGRRFAAPWLRTPRGPDRAITARLQALHRGDRVEVAWSWEEHLRVRTVRVIARGPVEEEPAKQPGGDF